MVLFDKNVSNILNLTIIKDYTNINLLIKEILLMACDKPVLRKAVNSFPLELFE